MKTIQRNYTNEQVREHAVLWAKDLLEWPSDYTTADKVRFINEMGKLDFPQRKLDSPPPSELTLKCAGILLNSTSPDQVLLYTNFVEGQQVSLRAATPEDFKVLPIIGFGTGCAEDEAHSPGPYSDKSGGAK